VVFERKRLEEVNMDDFEKLIENRRAEDKTLEYKRELKVDKPSDKKEFLADISAFANTSGGYLIYGIEESKGVPTRICGVELDDFDATKNRLEQMILDGIEPRIRGIEFHRVELHNERSVITIKIPKSWLAPHMVILDKHNRFYARNSTGKYLLDVGELRSLFLLSETIAEKAKRFVTERIGIIATGETPKPMITGGKICLHIIPLGAFDPRTKVDTSTIGESGIYLPPLGSSGYNHSYTIDGFLTFHGPPKKAIADAYALIFRNGIVETVNTSICAEKDNKLYIRASLLEIEVMEVLPSYIQLLKQNKISPPLFIKLNLIGVKGYEIHPERRTWALDPHPIERDLLTFPDIILEHFEVDLGNAMKPVFDALWNAGGYRRSPNYDEQGKWKRPF